MFNNVGKQKKKKLKKKTRRDETQRRKSETTGHDPTQHASRPAHALHGKLKHQHSQSMGRTINSGLPSTGFHLGRSSPGRTSLSQPSLACVARMNVPGLQYLLLFSAISVVVGGVGGRGGWSFGRGREGRGGLGGIWRDGGGRCFQVCRQCFE